MARILTWPCWLAHCTPVGNIWPLTLYKELHPVLWAQHGGMAARLQESRAEAGVVAALRTEAQRTAVWDDCAERPRGWLCGAAVQAERPRGWLCRQRGPEAETGLLNADSL